jgi:excisionase family DNA binding protein
MHNVQDAHTEAGTTSPGPREPLLTATQVQALLGVDRSTVYRMAEDGRLPAVKVGRQWRFPGHRIERMLEVQTPPPARATRETPAPPSALPLDAASAVIGVAAELLGVMMVVTDLDGRPLTDVANPCARFAEAAHDPTAIAACLDEWRTMAAELEFEPRFRTGPLGFACARSYIRSGDRLIGMVLAGGIADTDDDAQEPDLYHLDDEQRRQVLATLPKVATALSRAVAPAGPPGDHAVAGSPIDRRSAQ